MSEQLWMKRDYTNGHEPTDLLHIQEALPAAPIAATPTPPPFTLEPADMPRNPGNRRLQKVQQAVYEEIVEFHPRLELVNLLVSPLPMYVGGRLRTRMLRLAGFDIGSGTMLWGMPRLSGRGDLYRRLKIGNGCMFNVGCFLELGEKITIGDRAIFGHEVMILTTTHAIGSAECRCDAPRKLPVTIGPGVWVGARCTILPGVTIGAGAVVAAGSVVNKDVPENTLVAGVPARVIKDLD